MRHEYTPLSQVNVTSLVDITLVLLIVFMLTAPLLQEGMEIELPQAEVEGIDMSDSWIVTVGPDGALFLNDKRLALDDLGAAVETKILSGGSQEVFIRGDAGVPYGTVVRVIGVLKGAGVENLGIVAESEELLGENQ